MGEYYWVVLEGNLIFSLIQFLYYWGMRRNIKKNYKVVIELVTGWLPQ
jgi:hypothetical protein